MMLTVFVTTSLHLAFPLYFLLGMCYVGRYFGSYCAIIEYSEPKYKTLLGTFLLAMDSISTIMFVIIFQVTQDTLYVEIIGIAVNLLGVIAIWWLPETPEFLYNTMQYKQARLVLKRIARINGVKDYDSEFPFDTEAVVMRCKLAELTADTDLNESR